MSRGEFFAVDRRHITKACDLGLSESLAYLVIAAGTQRDMRTSAWSSDAIRRYCKIRWTRAREAISTLQRNRLLTRDKKSSAERPRYILQKPDHDHLVWLPNSLVTGVEDEDTPVSRLRRANSVDAVRTIIQLYSENDLQEEGGISTWRVHDTYDRVQIGERGQHRLWAFDYKQGMARHVDGVDREQIWPALHLLQNAGLLFSEAWVFDGPHDQTGEPLFPLEGPGAEINRAITEYIDSIEADLPSLTDHIESHEYIVPLERSYQDPHVVGIYQLRYLPRASYTLSAMAGIKSDCEQWAGLFAALAEGRRPNARMVH